MLQSILQYILSFGRNLVFQIDYTALRFYGISKLNAAEFQDSFKIKELILQVNTLNERITL